MQELIESARCRLVPVDRAGAEALLAAPPEARRAVAGWPHADSLAAIRAALQLGWPTWFVELRASGQVIGECGLKGWPDTSGTVEIGYGLAPGVRRLGYGREAVAALLGWLAQRGIGDRVIAEVLAANTASRRLLEGLGFAELRATGGFVYYQRELRPPTRVPDHALGTVAELRWLWRWPGWRVALITLETGGDEPNVLHPAALLSLRAAFAAASRGDPDAVALTGKPDSFAESAGGRPSYPSEDVAELWAAVGRLPTFAFINAPARGAGAQLARGARYRTIATTASLLGPDLPPAPGRSGSGTSGPPEPGVAAFDAGLVDALLEPADFLPRSLAFASDVLAGRLGPVHPERPRR